MNQKINLVMFGMSYYEDWLKGVENRNFHILQELLKQDKIGKIIYIDYLPWTFKQAVKTALHLIGSRLKSKNRSWPSWSARLLRQQPKWLIYSDFNYFFNRRKFYQKLQKVIHQELG